jgi:hypothetical protein
MVGRGTDDLYSEGAGVLERQLVEMIRVLFLESIDILATPFWKLRSFRPLFMMTF